MQALSPLFFGALLTCLDEKDEEMVLLSFAFVFNL
jgi:hypothetical protein